MVSALLGTPHFMTWTWDDIQPQYNALLRVSLTGENVNDFLATWTELADQVQEIGIRLEIETTRSTADEVLSTRYQAWVQDIRPKIQEADHRLNQKLLASGLEPEGMSVPLRNLRVETEIFREENLPLLAEESLLIEQYFKVTGNQTVDWEGKELPLAALLPVLEEQDRGRREQAWRLTATRRLADRDAIDDVWRKLLLVRRQIAKNAGFSDYRAYRWQELKRFDYTPDHARSFHRAVETVVVPAVTRLMEKRKQLLDLETLRPWDRQVDASGRPPLKPFATTAELISTTANIFRQVDPALGAYFEIMRQEELLDLESRKDKAPGGYCSTLPATRRPFIFDNGSGTQTDVNTLFHEGGHAFHAFETNDLPYFQQRSLQAVPMEFAEVASMAMELLANPFLAREDGGFYTREEAARARERHLENVMIGWCWIATIDAFQHWIYDHAEEAADAEHCDDVWSTIVQRFMPFVDWGGLEAERAADWRRVLHIFGYPFYYIEYGLAQIGACQVWANARRDRASAIRQYREALSLGGTRTLPELFEAAGARFAFDEGTFSELVTLIETEIEHLQVEQQIST